MTRYRKPGPPPVSKRTAATLLEVQQRQTVKRMIEQGGIVTPIGPNTHIRLPAPLNGFGTFPSHIVEDVQHAFAGSGSGRQGVFVGSVDEG